jgi:hypothetical protein
MEIRNSPKQKNNEIAQEIDWVSQNKNRKVVDRVSKNPFNINST